MSFLQGLFAKQASAAPATQPTQPVNTNVANPTGSPHIQVPTNQPEGNNQNIPNPTGAPNPTKDFNPLDALGILQQNTNTDLGQAPSLNISPEALSEAASKIDFGKLIPQDAMQRLQDGMQQGDLSALPELLTSVMRNSWQMGIQHNSALVDKYVKDSTAYQQTSTQQSVREQVLTSQLPSVKDLHPVAKNMFIDTAKRLSRQYPEASPAEIESEVWTIMKSFSGELDVDKKQQTQQARASEIDWDKYLDQ